jgi:hypothetical protein
MVEVDLARATLPREKLHKAITLKVRGNLGRREEHGSSRTKRLTLCQSRLSKVASPMECSHTLDTDVEKVRHLSHKEKGMRDCSRVERRAHAQ